MKRFLILFLSVVTLVGMLQWLRWHRLQQRQTELSSRIADALALDARNRARSGAATHDDAIPPAVAGTADARPVELNEFFDRASAISQLEGKSGDAARRQIQAMVQELFTDLSVTPIDQLLIILDRLDDQRISTEGRRQVASFIMGVLARQDPSAAASQALQSKVGARGLEVALRSWSRRDAAGAAAWLEQSATDGKLPPNVEVGELRQLLLPHLLVLDPAGEAVNGLAGVPADAIDSVFAETARLLTTEDQRCALFQRLAKIPNQPDAVIEALVRQVGRESSVETAMAMLTQSEVNLTGAKFNSLAATAATARIDAATPQHADWLLQHLRGPDREPAITKLMAAWTQADFNGVASWLRDRPSSTDHDAAISAFAPLVAATEPPSAVDWANVISDPMRRQEVIRKVYSDWHARSPEEAARYFAEREISAPADR